MNTLLRWTSILMAGALAASIAGAQGSSGAGPPSAAVSAQQYEQLYPQATAISQEELMEQLEVQAASLQLFTKALLNPRAHAMWVTYKDGVYEFVEFPLSDSKNITTWRGVVPENAVAVIHTHPEGTDERPCPMDRSLAHGKQAAAVRLPVYSLHRDRIAKVIPGVSEEVTIRERGWVNEFQQADNQLKATNHGVAVTTYVSYRKHQGNHR